MQVLQFGGPAARSGKCCGVLTPEAPTQKAAAGFRKLKGLLSAAAQSSCKQVQGSVLCRHRCFPWRSGPPATRSLSEGGARGLGSSNLMAQIMVWAPFLLISPVFRTVIQANCHVSLRFAYDPWGPMAPSAPHLPALTLGEELDGR